MLEPLGLAWNVEQEMLTVTSEFDVEVVEIRQYNMHRLLEAGYSMEQLIEFSPPWGEDRPGAIS